MAARSPYDRFREEELILRDHLAVDRTVLANERTLLAYVRTALGLAAVGLTLIHFFEGFASTLSGLLLIAAGVAALALGFVRYRRMHVRIQQVYRPDPRR